MPRRQPFRNNARLVLLCTAGAVLLFLGIQFLLRKSRDFSPDFLASVLLYGLTVLNLTRSWSWSWSWAGTWFGR